jgi:hypothetical protein
VTRPGPGAHPQAGRPATGHADVDADRSYAEAYSALTERLVAARRAVAWDPRHPRPWTERQADHQRLTSLLGDAVGQAVTADIANAPPPPGIRSWAAEGLARSTEREIAVFAAIDTG